MKLPKFLQAELATPPSAGNGVHNWLFRVARHLHAHMEEDDIFNLLRSKVEDCGREVPDREIWDAIHNSKGCASGKGGMQDCQPDKRWPSVNPVSIQRVVRTHTVTKEILSARSPFRLRPGRRITTIQILQRLFPAESLICAGISESRFATRPLGEWSKTNIEKYELIVPSPMTAHRGKRKSDGGLSAHTLDNTGPRQSLVIEFDSGTLDQQASLIWELGTLAPLVMVIFSGSKSLHAWFSCRGESEEDLRKFMAYAVSLGADKVTWTRSQFVRMPNAVRSNGNVQEVIFFNPELIQS